jgi:Uma2 family endonuclease
MLGHVERFVPLLSPPRRTDSMGMPQTVHRFTVDEFLRMDEAGIFDPDVRLELLDGEIVEMSPVGVPHAACVTRLTALLVPLLARRATVRIQNPLVLDAHQMPQPDIAVVRFRADGYAAGHPRATDALLVIEVADSSLRTDRRRKVPRYAQAEIPEAWLIDLPGDAVEVCREPRDGHYTDVRTAARRGDTIAPLAFPDLALRVEDILR